MTYFSRGHFWARGYIYQRGIKQYVERREGRKHHLESETRDQKLKMSEMNYFGRASGRWVKTQS